MKRLLFLCLGITLVLASCNNEKSGDERSVKVSVPGSTNGTKVFIAEMARGNQPVPLDTAVIKNDVALLHLPKVDFQTLNVLTVNGVVGSVLFINENEAVNIEVDVDDIRQSKIDGGTGNKLFSEYLQMLNEGNQKLIDATDNISQEDMQTLEVQEQIMALQQDVEDKNNEFRKKAIQENPNQLASILMLSDLVRMHALPQSEIKTLYDDLSSEVQNSYFGKRLGDEINTEEALAVGKKAPSFSAKTPEDKELSLEDALGKYTLVDFWAAWCGPCRRENPNIVKVYNEFHDKGFNVLGVSLDQTKDKWVEAIQQDGLPWNHVSNLKFWNDPIAEEYNIKAIPASFLLDENGIIIAKDLRGNALRQKLEELLNDSNS